MGEISIDDDICKEWFFEKSEVAVAAGWSEGGKLFRSVKGFICLIDEQGPDFRAAFFRNVRPDIKLKSLFTYKELHAFLTDPEKGIMPKGVMKTRTLKKYHMCANFELILQNGFDNFLKPRFIARVDELDGARSVASTIRRKARAVVQDYVPLTQMIDNMARVRIQGNADENRNADRAVPQEPDAEAPANENRNAGLVMPVPPQDEEMNGTNPNIIR